MSDPEADLPDKPWDLYAPPPPTATPPAGGPDLPDNPWDMYGPPKNPPPSVNLNPPPLNPGGTVALTPEQTLEQDKTYPPISTDPFEQRLVENTSSAVAGVGAGELAAAGLNAAGKGVASVFKAAPDLLNAGIKPTTLQKMTPAGQNPAVFGQVLEESLNKAGAIGKDAKETWDKMNALKEAAGKSVGDSLEAIAQQASSSGTPNPLAIDSQTALQPILEGWAERAGGATTTRKAMARPFEQVYTALSQKAAAQGGVLSLDDLRSVMDEIGPLTHKGPEALQAAMSELYGTLADARDGMVKTIADKANNPALAQNLLNANAEYSKYMRLMPDITKSAATYAVKQGVSAFQKYGGSTLLKFAEGAVGWEGLKKLVESFTGESR